LPRAHARAAKRSDAAARGTFCGRSIAPHERTNGPEGRGVGVEDLVALLEGDEVGAHALQRVQLARDHVGALHT
jgi:hypothetical protein